MNRLDAFGVRLAAWARSAGLVLVLISFSAVYAGAEPGSAANGAGRADETNAQETLRSYLQLQEQIHATQLAVERSRISRAGVEILPARRGRRGGTHAALCYGAQPRIAK